MTHWDNCERTLVFNRFEPNCLCLYMWPSHILSENSFHKIHKSRFKGFNQGDYGNE